MIDSRTLFELAQRFQQPLPRYTSYPTAAELSEKFDYGDLERHLHDTFSQQLPTALYVHLPYCKSLCYFCACSKVISADQRARHEYLSFLEKECVRLTALGTPEVNELHLGGGSPSYLSVSELEQLEFCLRQYFPASDLRKSIELDPRTIDSEKIGFLVENGYERISIGVQDFDPVVQQLVNRIQPVEMLEHVLEDLRSRDVHQINFDLIYGLPGQTRESFEETIREVCRLRPSRIALYGYAHVPWKMKVQKTLQKYGLPSPTDRLHLFTQAAIELQTQGYKYIGLDHFALPDDELSLADANQTLRRNFMGYTTFRDSSIERTAVIGVGSSSISDTGVFLYQNATVIEDYVALVKSRIPVTRALVRSNDTQARAFVIERIMCARELDFTEVYSRYRRSEYIFSNAQPRLCAFADEGLIELSHDRLKVTERGRYLLRLIASAFDAHLQEDEQRFSQAI